MELSGMKRSGAQRSDESAEHPAAALVDRALELAPRVALRPEPFGALAYHYGTRRLVFLRDRDLVRVVEALASQPTLGAAFDSCGIAERRRFAFGRAIAGLIESEMVRERADV
jgi:putative mycofactocin binding protein MftB